MQCSAALLPLRVQVVQTVPETQKKRQYCGILSHHPTTCQGDVTKCLSRWEWFGQPVCVSPMEFLTKQDIHRVRNELAVDYVEPLPHARWGCHLSCLGTSCHHPFYMEIHTPGISEYHSPSPLTSSTVLCRLLFFFLYKALRTTKIKEYVVNGTRLTSCRTIFFLPMCEGEERNFGYTEVNVWYL